MISTTGPLDPPGLPAPPLWRRMASFVYEGLLMFGIGLIPGAIGALFLAITGQANPLRTDAEVRAVGFALYAIYFTWFWSARGQTLAMQTWHIRVVTVDGRPLSQPRALLRFVASCAWVAPAAAVSALNHWTRWQAVGATCIGIVGYALLARLRRDRQFWHDAVVGTRLVDARPAASP